MVLQQGIMRGFSARGNCRTAHARYQRSSGASPAAYIARTSTHEFVRYAADCMGRLRSSRQVLSTRAEQVLVDAVSCASRARAALRDYS